MKNNKNETTLRDFLIQEHKLITSLGVFITLTLFSQSFINSKFSFLASSLFLLLALIIFFELWEQFPKKNSSTKLRLFETYLSAGSVFVFIYWLSELKKLEVGAHIIAITIFLYGPILTLLSNQIKKLDLFNRIFNAKNDEKKIVRYIFGYMIMFLTYFIIFLTVNYFREYIDLFLSTIN